MHPFCKWTWLCVGLASVSLSALALAKGPTDLGDDKIKLFKQIRPTELIPLIKGTRQVQKSDQKNIELAAEVLVWRASWSVKRKNPKFLEEVRKDFDREINEVMDKGNKVNNKDYRKMLVKYLLRCFKEVFDL